MTRVFLDDSQVEGDRATIAGPDAHHLLHVLRLRLGDSFIVVDQRGAERIAEIVEAAETSLVAHLSEPTSVATEPATALALYHGLPRTRRFETVLQMGTELGVAGFVPVLCARTVVRIRPEQAPAKADRWRRIVREAARQCGRTHVPEVAEPLSWHGAVERFTSSGQPGVMPDATLAASKAVSLTECLRRICVGSPPAALSLFIGPEGGFDLTERSQAEAAGIHLVTLGPRVLRSETAAVAAVTICLAELGALN